jgi:hypothetical protein
VAWGLENMSNSVLNAIAALGYGGFTAEDVALQMNEHERLEGVREELDELLCTVRGKFSVVEQNNQGVTVMVAVYDFPHDIRLRLFKRGAWVATREYLWPMVLRGIKYFIGFCLIFSIALIAVALLAILLRGGGNQGGGNRASNFYSSYLFCKCLLGTGRLAKWARVFLLLFYFCEFYSLFYSIFLLCLSIFN